MPWLAAKLSAKTHVRERTLGLEAGVVVVKGEATVTFDGGPPERNPGHGGGSRR
jgi:hypothetical protein